MIRKISILILALLCAGQLPGKTPISMEWGLKAGLSYQNVNLGSSRVGDYSLSGSGETGFYAGIMARITLPKIYIQPEINYSMNRYELTARPSSGAESHSTVRLNSIEVPVLLGKRFLQYFRIELGPVFNLWNESSTSSSWSDTAGEPAPAHAVIYSRSSIGYMAGLALDLGPVSLSGRYSGEFSRPVQAITIGDQTSEVETKVHAWQLSVGFRF